MTCPAVTVRQDISIQTTCLVPQWWNELQNSIWSAESLSGYIKSLEDLPLPRVLTHLICSFSLALCLSILLYLSLQKKCMLYTCMLLHAPAALWNLCQVQHGTECFGVFVCCFKACFHFNSMYPCHCGRSKKKSQSPTEPSIQQMLASGALCWYNITTWFLLFLLVLFSRVRIAGHAATAGGPNDERSEMIFDNLTELMTYIH